MVFLNSERVCMDRRHGILDEQFSGDEGLEFLLQAGLFRSP